MATAWTKILPLTTSAGEPAGNRPKTTNTPPTLPKKQGAREQKTHQEHITPYNKAEVEHFGKTNQPKEDTPKNYRELIKSRLSQEGKPRTSKKTKKMANPPIDSEPKPRPRRLKPSTARNRATPRKNRNTHMPHRGNAHPQKPKLRGKRIPNNNIRSRAKS